MVLQIMSPLLRKAGLALLASLILVAGAAEAQTVKTTSGKISGVTTNTVTAFKGIPYAKAPTGDLRWRAPQPATRWNGVRDGARYGADCAQAPFPPDAAPIQTTPSEDCLFLNVWRPETASRGDRLPVMVWVHGGGFVNGGSSPAVYSGAPFARDGIVFVSLNYRLGRFGFFAHPALATEGFGGNFGFLDQVQALKWVQTNIAAFGGDPDNVTVFGESAGGMSMHMLLQSPMARGLFAKAIIQSGGGRDRTPPNPTIAKAASAGLAFHATDSAADLRALPAETVTGDLSMFTMGQAGYSGPIIDGRTLLGSPIDSASAGLYAHVPVILGANSADGFPFVTDKTEIFRSFGPDEAEARRIHDPSGETPGSVVATATSADRMMIEPTRAVARRLASQQSVWLYRFGYAQPIVAATFGGAPHASEIPYVFDTVGDRKEPKMIDEEQPVADIAHRYWVNFARSGRPDADPASTPWPALDDASDMTTVQVIDGQGARNIEDPLAQRLDFAKRLAGHTP